MPLTKGYSMGSPNCREAAMSCLGDKAWSRKNSTRWSSSARRSSETVSGASGRARSMPSTSAPRAPETGATRIEPRRVSADRSYQPRRHRARGGALQELILECGRGAVVAVAASGHAELQRAVAELERAHGGVAAVVEAEAVIHRGRLRLVEFGGEPVRRSIRVGIGVHELKGKGARTAHQRHGQHNHTEKPDLHDDHP